MAHSSVKGFYHTIKKEYDDQLGEKKKNVFIYRYYKAIKDRDCSSDRYFEIRKTIEKNKKNNRTTRKDLYIYLKSAYIAYQEEKIDWEELYGVIKKSVSYKDPDDGSRINKRHLVLSPDELKYLAGGITAKKELDKIMESLFHQSMCQFIH